MSSHHFVKEGQEPALFIVEPLSLALVEPLLEWAPLVMVTDEAVQEVLRWGIKIDLAIVPTDRAKSAEEELMEQAPVRVLTYGPDEDPFVSGCNFLAGNKQKAVNIITTLSDELFAEAQPFTSSIQVVLMDAKTKWSAVTTGLYEKWLPSGSGFWVRKSDPNQEFYTQGIAGVGSFMETDRDGIVKVTAAGIFWIGESL